MKNLKFSFAPQILRYAQDDKRTQYDDSADSMLQPPSRILRVFRPAAKKVRAIDAVLGKIASFVRTCHFVRKGMFQQTGTTGPGLAFGLGGKVSGKWRVS